MADDRREAKVLSALQEEERGIGGMEYELEVFEPPDSDRWHYDIVRVEGPRRGASRSAAAGVHFEVGVFAEVGGGEQRGAVR